MEVLGFEEWKSKYRLGDGEAEALYAAYIRSVRKKIKRRKVITITVLVIMTILIAGAEIFFF